jgi:kynurenine formamidase
MSSITIRKWLDGCYIKADGSNLVDLTHEWHEGMTQPAFFPPMIQEEFHTHEKQGVFSRYNHLLEECGTHCEAPIHIFPNTLTIEKVPPSWLIGPAVIINIRDKCQADPDYKLSIQDLMDWEAKHGRIPNNSWLIMYSGWSDKWGSSSFFNVDREGKDHHPGFDPVAMRWLVDTDRHIIGIATECGSPEGGTATRPSNPLGKKGPSTPVRNELLPVWNTLVIECLANLDKLPEAGAWIIVGVIPFKGGSAGQARIFGILPVKETEVF